MTHDHSPENWPRNHDDDAVDITPATESKGELIPPPPKPPTAIGAEMSGPEPTPPRDPRRWKLPPRRSDLPPAVARAVDSILDVLDSIGDTVRSTAGRLAP